MRAHVCIMADPSTSRLKLIDPRIMVEGAGCGVGCEWQGALDAVSGAS